MKIIGIAGPNGAGKTTVAGYLYDKYGFEVISIGDIVREEVLERGMELTAKNLDKVAEDMVEKGGESYWIKKTIDRLSGNKCEGLVIDGLMRKFEIQFLRTKFKDDVFIVFIETLPETRFKRMKKSEEPDFPKTVDEFIDNEKRKKIMFDSSEILSMIAHKITNNGKIEELYSEIDEMVRKFKLC